MIESKPYYPSNIKLLIDFFNKGELSNVIDIIVEPDYGYFSRINYKNGSFRIIYGNDTGLNLKACVNLANDKAYTKFLLQKIGVKCPNGNDFILPWYANELSKDKNPNISKNKATTANLKSLVEYPCYIKPIDGSKGIDIFIANNFKELHKTINLYNKKRIRVAVVEEKINMPDYRLVILDSKLICAYKKTPPTVIGDGKSKLSELIKKLNTNFSTSEVNRIKQYLKTNDVNFKSIPKEGQTVALLPISNLSAGGSAIDITDKVSQKIINLSIKIAHNFGLRFCGIDIACEEIGSENTDYRVFEVNATPGLDYYAKIDQKQQDVVKKLFLDIFNNN